MLLFVEVRLVSVISDLNVGKRFFLFVVGFGVRIDVNGLIVVFCGIGFVFLNISVGLVEIKIFVRVWVVVCLGLFFVFGRVVYVVMRRWIVFCCVSWLWRGGGVERVWMMDMINVKEVVELFLFCLIRIGVSLVLKMCLYFFVMCLFLFSGLICCSFLVVLVYVLSCCIFFFLFVLMGWYLVRLVKMLSVL